MMSVSAADLRSQALRDPQTQRRGRRLPQPPTLIRLVGAVLAEQHDEWTEMRRCIGLAVLSKSRQMPIPTPGSADGHDRRGSSIVRSRDCQKNGESGSTCEASGDSGPRRCGRPGGSQLVRRTWSVQPLALTSSSMATGCGLPQCHAC